MASDLPRLKPVPLPAIHPVPEYEAAGALADAYARTKRGLGVPWMGVVAMAFAHYPNFYNCLWTALEPVIGTEAFASFCRSLRDAAETQAERLGPPDILPRLESMGYGRREIDEIRACNEVFSDGNMPYLLMATLARLLLEGHAWQGQASAGTRQTPVDASPKPTLMEAHHVDPTMAAIYQDIRETLGLPFVNTDYRAFARWPSYFAPAWADLKGAVTGPGYVDAVEHVHRIATELALALPNAARLTSEALRDAAKADAELDDVLSVVRLFQWLLPGLAVNVAFLRAQIVAR
ncbi:halocarboxylic acid dehydrogenase DehI family protein [Maritalea mobilis]|uniref:halocarboxylic acid dehydrogenase DehI family protein n=1 Tax=Maritalea mobilis TaxID=483324 RepID=UPI001C96D773|nr:halocarboxylic acid dehydrogenase DehI family protein [Maritalea mobilis]MBY6201429.1 halocarboxylic acid dehydrogenase DehI family protein [Maritalea mobilis]